MRNTVSFYLNGTLQHVVPSSPTQTVLQFLREQAGLVGTKEGCAEGDCGACTITEAVLESDGQLAFRAVNACIRFLPTLDGRAIWTVEGVSRPGHALHPVQQAMVDFDASQCGFCTPGFVMSLYTLYRSGQRTPSRDEVLDCLSGNLCRCTGYRPIIEAAMNMGQYPEVDEALALLKDQLQALRQTDPTQVLQLSTSDQQFRAPTCADQLAEMVDAQPDATLLAGGTDLGLMVTKQLRRFDNIIYLGNVTDLDAVSRGPEVLTIGAAVLLNKAYAALALEYPETETVWKRFASTPIRNSGTLVGNLANGSPIGDSAPLLIVLQTRVVLRKGRVRREIPLEDLYLDYRKQARVPGEFLESIKIPLRKPGLRLATYKLSKRFDQDISAVCGAYAIQEHNGIVVSARIAYGGMAATSKRASNAEEALLGKPFDRAHVLAAMAALASDYQPLTDMRASADYRLQAAQNLLYRFYLESTDVSQAHL